MPLLMVRCAAALAVSLVSATAIAAPPTLANDALRVELDAADGSLVVTDLRTKEQWLQVWRRIARSLALPQRPSGR